MPFKPDREKVLDQLVDKLQVIEIDGRAGVKTAILAVGVAICGTVRIAALEICEAIREPR